MEAQELITILAQHPDAKIQYGYIDGYTSTVTHCEYVEEYNIFILS